MKRVSTSELINLLKEAVRKIEDGSETRSIRGQFFTVDYLISSVLKNGYYAKNQQDKTDKNPYWGRDIKAIKCYNAQLGTDYAKQAIKDGKTLSDKPEEENPFESIISNLIFRHKTSGRYYIQVMAKAFYDTYYLDGEPMSDADKACLDKYKKPFDPTKAKSDDYKKLCLDKVLFITLGGETYKIDDTQYITIPSEKETEATTTSK